MNQATSEENFDIFKYLEEYDKKFSQSISKDSSQKVIIEALKKEFCTPYSEIGINRLGVLAF